MAGTPYPQITVEIRGADRCGKTVVGQLLRDALRKKLITTIGPVDAGRRYDKDMLYSAVADLIGRGLSVEIVETETAGPVRPKVPVDATIGWAR